jgi:HEXXH motif-containing protein
MFGAMWSTVDCPFMLAENFVHEMAHQKLYGIGIFKEHCTGLIANDPGEGFRSPVLDYPRPMTAIVHAVYSYMYVTALDLAILEQEPSGPRRDSIVLRLDVNVGRLEDGRAEMHGNLRLDAEGEQFFAGFYAWLNELIAQGRAIVSAGVLAR